MLFSPRMSLKQLAGFSQRAAMALLAGIDERTICAREAQIARGAARRRLANVSQAVNGGGALSEAMADDDFFPPLFREMVLVGEQSGRLGEVFRQLANHYEHQIALRRNFLASIAWPAVQLFLAVVIVGFLIWIMGIINGGNPRPIDPLGFGLIGNTGLAWYAAIVMTAAAAVALAVRAVSRGLLWTRPLQRFVLYIPKLGPALQTIALARLAWVMAQTMNTSMDVRRSLRLALQSTRNAWYIDRIEPIDARIAAGDSIYDAFCAAGGFPGDFLESLHVGEQSGKVVESMGRLADDYQDQARAALSVLATLGGFAVWGAVAAIIIFLIFRLAMFYLGALNAAGLG